MDIHFLLFLSSDKKQKNKNCMNFCAYELYKFLQDAAEIFRDVLLHITSSSLFKPCLSVKPGLAFLFRSSLV